MELSRIAGGAFLLGLAMAVTPAAADTLEDVKKAGVVKCGVSQGLPGFSNPDDKGNWTGLDVDLCRGLAAAIFNDPSKVAYRALSSKDRFTALQSGEVDLLSRNSTWTISRDAALGLDFAAINYYDGQGFMARKADGIKSAKELDNVSVCTETGTTTELNIADFFRSQGHKYQIVAYQTADEAVKSYEEGRCDVFTTDVSGLYSYRVKFKAPADHVVLPEIISKEPLGPIVRQGDDRWGDIVRWTHFAMLNAEEMGITSKNLAEQAKSNNPEIRRFLGLEGDLGAGLGLTNDWAQRIIKHVGNYAEAFDRNVGAGSQLGIARAQNALYKDGGLQYAPPMR